MKDFPRVETVKTNCINTGDVDMTVPPSDYGEVPILVGETLSERSAVTDCEVIAKRQNRLEFQREKLENMDLLTDRDKKNRTKDKISELEDSVVLVVSDVEDTTDKRSIVAELTGLPVEDVDKRLLTSLVIADYHDAVSDITFVSNGVKIHLEDGYLSGTGLVIEVVSVGDEIVVQGRCNDGNQRVLCTFPESFFQESDVLQQVETLLGGVRWNL